MNKTINKKNTLMVSGLLALGLVAVLFFVTNNNSVAIENLSDAEKAGLIQMRQEEKLARDVYDTLSQKWNIRSFGNITQSEQTHTSKVKELLDMYNIPDPITDDTVGVYKDKEFTDLYNNLVAEGNKGLTEALKVGVTIENLDIKDLDTLISKTQNQNILTVYENLRRASYNHLNAFTRNLDQN